MNNHSTEYLNIDICVGDEEIRVSGKTSFEDLAVLSDLLGKLPFLMLASIKHVVFHSNTKHFNPAEHGHSVDSTICLRNFDYPHLIWHEAAHNYTRCWGRFFLKRWEEIADVIYCGVEYAHFIEAYKKGIASGILTAYGRCSALEDIAEWTEQIYKYSNGVKSVFDHSEKIDKADPRFLRKFEFLHSYGFFSKEMHDKIKPLLS